MRPPRGASLIEALLAVFLLALVAIPIFGMLEGTTQIFARGDAAATLQQDLRAAVDQLVREVRMAGYDPSATGSPAAFEVAAASSVRFLADTDNDGVSERVEYLYDSAARTVTRQVWRWAGAAWGGGSGARVLARNVDSLALAYFDATEATTGTLAAIRRVTVTVAASRLVPGRGLERYTVTSEVRARNLP